MDEQYVNETVSRCPDCGGELYDYAGHLRCTPCDETFNLSVFYVPIIEQQQQRIAELEQPGFWKTEADRYFNEIVHLKDTARTNEQRIAELEAQLNTRNLAVERNGDPLREKFKYALDEYANASLMFGIVEEEASEDRWCEHRKKLREELDARISTLVDIVRVLVRDNKAQQADLRRYKAALESIRSETVLYDEVSVHKAHELALAALEGGTE